MSKVPPPYTSEVRAEAIRCEKAGITGLHFHDPRGSGATVAMRYQHATSERDQSIANKLGALMRATELEPKSPTAAVLPIDG